MTDVIEITYDGNPVRLVMYQGVLNKIIRACDGEIDNLTMNFENQEKVLEILSVSYDEKGNPSGTLYDPFKLSTEDSSKIIEFALENFGDFLLKRAESAKKIMTPIAEKLKKIQDSIATPRG